MYKTISVTNQTYQELNNLATRLNKPKSQLIEELLSRFKESMKEQDQQELAAFNAKMQKLISTMQLPKGTKVSTDAIDADFTILKDKTTEI